ncbi:MAG: hypothetical protein B7Y25_05060 [Alphaproteobacteria bacterium 16-39-46]|nr:MAG: hypothetical protein B7Y25_05060 [Alphaproteobacteria bacterium 16-39-46]OZA42814.1 MAG: hypothetical protein B7X84_04810 [Alphaproteobacteria bacterium 17-39-52]HQS84261.1 hypothetical protein [Alphaproteobacteria bacterium]HQS94123.1 hypothetical protein [Alphaproteobacteria bacterium]
MKNLTSFTVFEMRGHPIHYIGLSALCDAFSKIKTLKTFYVEDIGEDEAEAEVKRNELLEQQLKKLLKKCIKLKNLNLTNALSPFLLDDMARYFARPPLRLLNLSANFFDGETAKALVEALKKKERKEENERLRLILKQNNVYPHEIRELKIETLDFEVDLSDQDVM